MFPEEIWLHVFQALPNTEAIKLAGTCKTFHQLLHSPILWKEVIVADGPRFHWTDEKIGLLFRNLPFVETLIIKPTEHLTLGSLSHISNSKEIRILSFHRSLLPKCGPFETVGEALGHVASQTNSSLQRLTITGYRGNQSESDFIAFTGGDTPNTPDIDLDDLSFDSFHLEKKTVLERIELPGLGLSDYAMIVLTAFAPSLTKIDLSESPSITDFFLRSLATSCPQLRDLTLGGTRRNPSRITDKGVRFLAECCSHLESLKIFECQKLTQLSISTLFTSQNFNFHTLHLTSCLYLKTEPDFGDGVSQADLAGIFGGGSQSQGTSHSSEFPISDGEIRKLLFYSGSGGSEMVMVPSMRSLHLTGSLLSDESLEAIVARCPNLDDLNIHGCGNIGDFGISAIANHCPHLTSLDVDYCNTSDFGISKLASNCRNLTKLAASKNVDRAVSNRFTDDAVWYLTTGCPNLSNLTLRMGVYSEIWAMLKQTALPRNLTELNLSGSQFLSDPCEIFGAGGSQETTPPNFSFFFPNLKILNLSHTLLSDRQMESIFGISPNILFLNLSFCEKITFSIFGLANQHLCHLRKWDLSACPGLCDAPSFFHPPKGESSAQNSNSALLPLLQTLLPNLRALEVVECQGLTNGDLKWICESVPSLKYIDFRRCRNVDNASECAAIFMSNNCRVIWGNNEEEENQ